MKKQTICFITDAFISDPKATITGPMVQTYQLGKELIRRGWNVHFISYSKENKTGSDVFEDIAVTWIPYRAYRVFFAFFRIYRTLKIINPDVCYQRGRDPLTGVTAIYCSRKSKYFIWASAGESGVLRCKYKRSLKEKNKSFFKHMILFPYAVIQDILTEYGIRNAHRIVVQTAYQRDLLLREFGLPSVVIKSGHPVPSPVQRGPTKKFLWIGSIKPVKQPELFIELARRCQDLNCEFIIAGQMIDPVYGDTILRLIQSTPNIHYAGTIPFLQSQNFIAKAHALINTTKKDYEGLPNAFVQAWLAGTITLSLECDPDGVIEQNGLGFYTRTMDAMAGFIRDHIQNEAIWKTMSSNASHFAIKNYSIHSIVDQLIQSIE